MSNVEEVQGSSLREPGILPALIKQPLAVKTRVLLLRQTYTDVFAGARLGAAAATGCSDAEGSSCDLSSCQRWASFYTYPASYCRVITESDWLIIKMNNCATVFFPLIRYRSLCLICSQSALLIYGCPADRQACIYLCPLMQRKTQSTPRK